ncbi:FAD-binding oxidoreductase [Actinocorallia longicatena]|uniref:FAD-binding oxidoreductase n=1 Tax=Actinocorallia longicatena TaxID=111803 RepID=A0ABP6QL45_9ACTN
MLEERLAKVTRVVSDPSVVASYTRDYTGRWEGRARLVVRPRDTGEVAEAVRICAEEGARIVSQGGNTGLGGGGIPMDGEVVLSLRGLDRIGPVDVAAGQVSTGAGVVLSDLQREARRTGLDFGVDLASRGSATIGGMIATNAGGERVLRYGMTRANVVGVEAVLADGSLWSRLGGLPKDNAGFEPPFAGSEGILGIITAARLRLVPLLDDRATAMIGFASAADAVAALVRLRGLGSLEMAEFLLPDGLRLVCGHTGLPHPMRGHHAFYVIVECADRRDPSEELYAVLEELDPPEVVVAADAADQHRLWTYRESHAEAINTQGVPLKLDVAVPLGDLPAFLDDLPALAGKATPYLFGHLAEANVHVNLIGADDVAAVTEAVLERVAAAGGSISAEHGVGRAKTGHLRLSRSAAEIAVLRAVKDALDPGGLFNPGVLLP